MSCITTYTGKHIDPSAPDMAQVDIRDIAHALSMTCRGNGHVKTFFSVGQHCIWCCREAEARGYAPRLVLACLLHDACEAYMSDVPRPFKHVLPAYIQAEEQFLDLVYEKYLGTVPDAAEKRLIRDIDDDLLWYDLKHLLNDPPEKPAPAVCVPPDYTVVPFFQTEQSYLALFDRWSAQL